MSNIYKVPAPLSGTVDFKGVRQIINRPELYVKMKALTDEMSIKFDADISEVKFDDIEPFYKLLRKFVMLFNETPDADLYLGYGGGKNTLAYIDGVLDIFENGTREAIYYLTDNDYISFPIYYSLKNDVFPYFKEYGRTRQRKADARLGFGLRNLVGSAHERLSEVSQGATLRGDRVEPIREI